MKKVLILITVCIVIFMMVIAILPTRVNASEVIDQKTESKLQDAKSSQEKAIQKYIDKYNGSKEYGMTAYILHAVQIYSIPICFLGIVISFIYKVVLGARHLENAEKGLGMMITIVTLTIICQVLPMIFAVVVKLGKG